MPLPIEVQKNLLKARIKPGSVIHFFCNFIDPPHFKFFIVLHVDFSQDFLLIVLINSRIPLLVRNDQNRMACQILFERDSHQEYLTHDSHVDCSTIFDEIVIDELLNHLLEHPSDIRAEISKEEKAQILEKIMQANTITDYDKELIYNSLDS